jgi:ABC-type molybdate transport system substrate-binding protein
MRPGDGLFAVGAVAIVVAAAAGYDLNRAESASIIVYTTPALRDLLEKDIIPRWLDEGGLRIEPVYMAAGQEYNRLRMSGDRPEAEVFLHSSPLYLQKGFEEGFFSPIDPPGARDLSPGFRGNATGPDGFPWVAWAWSPLVEIYAPHLEETPDLASAKLDYGLAHPTLSNNGVYSALLLEEVSPEAGAHARSRTVVQPVNARTNIIGVADDSFDVTLGFEAVAEFFLGLQADIKYDWAVIDGRKVTTPVLFCAAVVEGAPHEDEATDFVSFLLREDTQAALADRSFRPVLVDGAGVEAEFDGVGSIHFDWQDWRSLEAVLDDYEVTND